MRLSTHHFQYGVFNRNTNTSAWIPNVLAWFKPVWRLHGPETESFLESFSFWMTWRYPKRCDESIERSFRNWFRAMHSGATHVRKCVWSQMMCNSKVTNVTKFSDYIHHRQYGYLMLVCHSCRRTGDYILRI